MTRHQPLSGVTVVDFTRILAGPMCTMLLSDLGAEVIKIERPDTGDDTRSWGPPSLGADATYYLGVNRGKKSVALDLRDTDDLATARALIDRADVVIENFRDGVMAKFGLDYDSLRHDRPELVYCSIPAYAEGGEGKPGYDLLMQASTGMMSVTGVSEPTKVGVAILDVVTGLYAALGVVSALSERRASGEGQRVVVGLFEASVSALANQAAGYLLAGLLPGLSGNEHPSIVPYQLFTASDTAFVVAAGNDKLYQSVTEVVGRPDLAADDRFVTNSGRVAHREELVGQLQAEFDRRTAEEWVDALEDAGVPAACVRTLDQVFMSPEGQATVMEIADERRGPLRYVRNPIMFSATPTRSSEPPPDLGQDTESILARLTDRSTDHAPIDREAP